MRPPHHFPRRHPVRALGDVVGFACLIAGMASLPWLLPILATLME